jgi:hypothetical protein
LSFFMYLIVLWWSRNLGPVGVVAGSAVAGILAAIGGAAAG